MGNKVFKIKDEKKNIEFVVKTIPVEEVVIPETQRDLSKTLVQRLILSIDKIGFVVPIIVVRNEESGKYEVIDGQHRYEAAVQLGYTKLPAIIVPQEYKDYMLTYNIEKPSNLRDKAHQSYMIYKEKVQNAPDSTEMDWEYIFEIPYYITVGIVIEELNPKFSGYHWEQLLKKIDNIFFDMELPTAYEERRKMAELLNEANDILNERYNELGLNNALLKRELVTKAIQNVYGKRVRVIEDDYYTAIRKIMEELKNVELVDSDNNDTLGF
jgi:ParB family chromosome partitioning protein